MQLIHWGIIFLFLKNCRLISHSVQLTEQVLIESIYCMSQNMFPLNSGKITFCVHWLKFSLGSLLENSIIMWQNIWYWKHKYHEKSIFFIFKNLLYLPILISAFFNMFVKQKEILLWDIVVTGFQFTKQLIDFGVSFL